MSEFLLVPLVLLVMLAVVLRRLTIACHPPVTGYAWHVEPGYVGHDAGNGWVASIIQLGTKSIEAHSWVYVHYAGLLPDGLDDIPAFKASNSKGWLRFHAAAAAASEASNSVRLAGVPRVPTWVTAEAWGNGVRYRVRQRPPVRVQRVARDAAELRVMLHAVARIVDQTPRYGWGEIARIAFWRLGVRVRRGPDTNPNRMICSHFAALCSIAARPEVRQMLAVEPCETWPGHLSVTLDRLQQRDLLVTR